MSGTVNGVSITSGRLVFGLSGTWYGELEVVGTDTSRVSGPVVVELGGLSLAGTASASADAGSLVRLEVVGGAGGLGVSVPALHYSTTTIRAILTDALELGGEALSPLGSAATLDAPVTSWARMAGTVADAVKRVLAPLGASWRVLPDGTVWAGVELWPVVEPAHTLEREDRTQKLLVVAIETLGIMPGTTFLGERVSQATYHIDAAKLRCEVQYGSTTGGGLGAELAAFVKGATAGLDYQAPYLVRIVAQNADETCEIVPFDERIPPMSKRPIRPGLAGVVSLKVLPGTLAILEFENGDPSSGVITGFASSAASKVVIEAPEVVLGGEVGAQFVALANLVKAELNKIAAAYNAHTHTGNGAIAPIAAQQYFPGDVAAVNTRAR